MRSFIVYGFFLMLAFHSGSGYAQGWQLRYGTDVANDKATAITKLADGQHYAVLSYSTILMNATFKVSLIDVDGQMVWSINLPAGYNGSSIIWADSAGGIYTQLFSFANKFQVIKLSAATGDIVQWGPSMVQPVEAASVTPGGLTVTQRYTDSLVVSKLNTDLVVLWSKTFPVAQTTTLGIAPTGRLYFKFPSTTNTSLTVVYALNDSGDVAWDINVPNADYDRFDVQANGDLFMFKEDQVNCVYTIEFQHINKDKQVVANWQYTLDQCDFVPHIYLLSDTTYFLVGHLATYITHVKPRFYRLDVNGGEIWKNKVETTAFTLFGAGAVLTPDDAIVCAGTQLQLTGTDQGNGDVAVWRVDANGAIAPNLLKGRLLRDDNQNCSPETTETGLGNWKIQLDNLYTITDSAGNYQLPADTGLLDLAVFPPGDYWETCPGYDQVLFSAMSQTINLDIPVAPLLDCTQMEVNIGFPFLRRCFENTATVSWYNYGTITSENTHILVVLPPELDFTSATWPVAQVAGDSLWFDVGSVPFNTSGSFLLKAIVDCDSTVVDQTLCIEAFIIPDTFCAISPDWSGAHLEVEATCVGDTLVRFEIKNTGTMPSDPSLDFIIIEDQVVLLTEPVTPLDPGGFRIIEQLVGQGSLYRMEVDQEPFHPGRSMPNAWVEGCGMPPVPGLALQYPLDDADLFKDVDCHRVIASYDPNDKTGLPLGVGADHAIAPGTDITYRIRFQNTGTDTAFLVVIRDTLSEWLDVSSIRVETASHPFQWQLAGGNVLKCTFNNILLPDSNTNEAASHGFVNFRIRPRANALPGTPIFNSAAIYFDFNAPVVTNTTLHTIEESFLPVPVHTPASGKPACVLAPNPAGSATALYFEQAFSGRIEIHNTLGALVRSQLIHDKKQALVEIAGLSSGVYWYRVQETDGHLYASGKMILK
jgi:uncharacterized repeat protein (TIGR01451 family)